MVLGDSMSYIIYAKKYLTRIPYPIGKIISLIPYDFRPSMGGIYLSRKNEINFCENSNNTKQFIFERVKNISCYAYQTIPFYQELYTNLGINPNKFSSFEDLKELPVVTKADLQQVPLEFRSNEKIRKTLVNTGGSSGQPFSFFVEPNSIPHEWAHMHTIWAKLGYRQSDLKVVFGGRADVKSIVEYDAVRHQFTVDMYKPFDMIADKLLLIFKKYQPKYLHGYPSAIFDFIMWLNDSNHLLFPLLEKHIKGLFLGLEYPSPILRKQVETLLSCYSVSWYGHTERAILAYEKDEQYTYVPFMSYGFPEAIYDEKLNGFELIATSYYNRVSPLIRYNTGDLINPNFKDGLLLSFNISEGRRGEYVLDSQGNKIYLTALIFGRHHLIFNYVKHIQVKQVNKGEVLFYLSTDKQYSSEFILAHMDLSNVDLKCSFELIREPVKTISGKVPLLVKE